MFLAIFTLVVSLSAFLGGFWSDYDDDDDPPAPPLPKTSKQIYIDFRDCVGIVVTTDTTVITLNKGSSKRKWKFQYVSDVLKNAQTGLKPKKIMGLYREVINLPLFHFWSKIFFLL